MGEVLPTRKEVEAEEKVKQITNAYDILKRIYASK